MDHKKITWEDNLNHYELGSRNVGDKNPEATIQMELQTIPKAINSRVKLTCINIPKNKVEEFLKSIK